MLARRTLIKLSGGAAAFCAWPALAQALKSLTLFVPAAPGGGWDQTGRAIEAALKAEKLIESAQVEHAPGAGGAVGLPRFLSQKKGQANALMVGGMVMVGALIANRSPVKLTSAVPVARLTGEFEVIVVPAASPLQSMRELIALFKADPTKVSWAGGSAGGTDHILAGMIAKAVGVDPKKISYVAYAGGGPAQAAILGNQVTCGVSGWGEFAEQIKAGKMRALALSADKRQDGIDVPTLREQGIDVELFNWRGVFGAPGIAPAERQALIDLMARMAAGAAWQAELKKKDWTGIFLAGDAFDAYLKSEIVRIEAILKELGIG